MAVPPEKMVEAFVPLSEVPKILYLVNFPDGSELRVEVPETATLRELYSTVCSKRAVPISRLQLIPSGHSTPLQRSAEKLLLDAMGDVRELMAVASRHMDLGAEKRFGWT